MNVESMLQQHGKKLLQGYYSAESLRSIHLGHQRTALWVILCK